MTERNFSHEAEAPVADGGTISSEEALLGDSYDVQPRQRVRFYYEKGELIKFISHHDEFRLWERTLRRAELPLLYKQGFNPQPHMQFAAPLGVGITGVREPMDLILSHPLPLAELAVRVRAKLPPGVKLVDLEEVSLRLPALSSLLIGSDYRIVLYLSDEEMGPVEVQERIARVLAETVIWRERERKGEPYTYNLRPLILELRYAGYDSNAEEHHIFLRVQQRSGANGRPDEVVSALGLEECARTLRRERIYFADVPEDAAVLAPYRVIEQAEIRGPRPPRRQRGAGAANGPAHTSGRSISERASDEFD